ncbi:sodium channel protein 1 brain isoform X4 [Parasteatoda tepidariorum]|uniref:sodium channel protein 1 brain isoform X4 n=1 Tax=Parasteatoda tepidariorum TaxID=114398 RepID=UPI00077FE019|nr:sodium channel protein 60E isoform X4 [Parasteatoda tepidariorum]
MQSRRTFKRLPSEYAFDIPLKEVDPKVSGDTFCVITRSWDQTFINRYQKSPSLNLFYPYSYIRRASMAFTTHIIYDIGILFIVAANLMNLVKPGILPLFFERLTLLFYVTEAIHQSISRGFVGGSYSYLRNPWMCFDFMITILSLYNFDVERKDRIPGLQTFRGIRLFPIVAKIPGVRILVRGLVLSVTQMMSVTTIIFIFLTVVSITAKHIFKGVLYNKCVRNLPSNFTSLNISYFHFIQNSSNWLMDQNWNPLICGNVTGARKCYDNYTCLPDIGSTPFENISNFDTFSISLLNSLRLISTDTWELLLDDILHAVGPLCGFFFVPVVLIGTYYLKNLMLIVVVTAFESAMENKEKERLSSYSYYDSFPFDIERLAIYPLETTRETLDEVLQERCYLIDHRKAVQEKWKQMKNIITMKQAVIKQMQAKESDIGVSGNNGKYQTATRCWKYLQSLFKTIAKSAIFEKFILFIILVNAAFLAAEHSSMSQTFFEVLEIGNMVFVCIFSLEFVILFIAFDIRYFSKWFNILDFFVLIITILSVSIASLYQYRIVRTFRLFSLLRFQKSWHAFKQIIDITIASFFKILRLVILLSLVIFIFGVITNQVLGSYYEESPDPPRWSFATFGGSAFIVLNVITGEWIDFLFTCIEVSDKSSLCPFLFIIMFVIANLVIVSLFTALLLSSFEDHVQFDRKRNRLSQLKGFVFHLFSVLERQIVDMCKKKGCIEFFDDLKETKLYLKLKQFACSNTFEGITIFFVFWSCLIIILDESGVDEHDTPIQYMIVKISSFSLAVLFTFEMLLRWLAIGLKSYFTEPYTILDFITLTTIVGALVLSLPVIFRVVIVCLFFWLPFAILGINFFAGLFFRCVDYRGNVIDSSVVSGKIECLEKNYTWKNNFMNFDHIGNSYMTLFQAALFANWADLAQLMVDHRRSNMQPLINAHPEHFIFVILFLLVGGFFTINLFVGVAVDTFKTMHKRVEGGPAEFALTKPQMLYYRAMRKIGRRKFMILVEPPSNLFCKKCFKIIDSWWFRIASFILICTNTIIVAASSYKISHTKARTLHLIQYSFIPFYLLECLIKICGLGKHYFKDIFNIQDLCTFVVYIVGEIVHNIFGTPANVCAFLFAFRITRVFDLLQLTDVFVSLRLLMYATIASIPSLLNLCLLLFIIHFIYAIVGIALFGYVKHSGYLNTQSNFERIQNALLVLFRLTTSEGWEKVYEGLSIEPPQCVYHIYTDHIWTSNCGNKVAAAIFLVSFIFWTNIILVNIFIAVILDNYKAAISEEQDIFKERNLILFNKTWRKYDPTGTQFIHIEKLPTFLDELTRDLRVAKPNGIAIAYMELPITTANQVHSLEVLQGILKVKSGRVEDTDVFVALRNQMHLRYERMFPELKGSRFIFTTMELKRRNYAAKILQMNFKKLQQSRLTLMEIERRKIKLDVLSAFPSSHKRPSLAPSRRLSILANQLYSTVPSQKVSRKRKIVVP